MTQSTVLDLIRKHQTEFEEELAFMAQTLSFVEKQAAFWQRSTLEGHLTGSAWVCSADGSEVLLLHHAKLDRWLQPGGHVDAMDESLIETARREAMEECGMQSLELLSPSLFDLDVHEIPARGTEPAHFHYDLRFLFRVPEGTQIERNLLETNAIAWVNLEELCTASTPMSLRRMALKSLIFQRDSERF